MSENKIARIILFPISLLYGGIIALRNVLYEQGILKSVQFNIPVISLGNLTVGGTGKTPHTAYLLRLLSSYVKVATMSRGYGRKSRGFRLVETQNTAQEAGDEPLLLKYKFPNLTISVSEDRATGIPKLMGQVPDIQTVILDDAFQHRSVEPYINILLTCYDSPFSKDWMIPTGTLREWPSAHKRADVMIVTKCPNEVSEAEKADMIVTVEAGDRPIFFTKYRYAQAYFLFNNRYRLNLNQETKIILLSAIAGTAYLLDYLTEQVQDVFSMAYQDHHDFTDRDVGQLELMYRELEGDRKAIICTEKDAVRLIKHKDYLIEKKLPIFVLPIDVEFLFGEEEKFQTYITNKLLEFKA
jgi:tetraacyldisaccharide 4'-kinase